MGKKRKGQVIPAVADDSSESDVEERGEGGDESEDSGRELLGVSTPIVKGSKGDGGDDEDGPPTCEPACMRYRLIHGRNTEVCQYVGGILM